MKKLILILVLSLALVGCATSTTATTSLTTTTTPSATQTETTAATGVPNGLPPLSAVSDCDVPLLDGGWVCVWADEFSGDAVDETKWTFEVNGDGGGNNELQYYTRNNATVSDGILAITARAESYGGKLYTSSRINTKYKAAFQYVKIVFRAQMPAGRGTWPAIWMMPLLSAYGGWPNSGEIDMMEYVGYNPDTVYTTLHTKIYNGMLGNMIGYSKGVADLEEEFHDFEYTWTPGHMEMAVDGITYAQFNYVPGLSRDYKYNEVWPFDTPFFLIMNLAVGGNWGGSQGVDPTIFPTSLLVDYVRVYKLDYATLDLEAPSAPEDLEPANVANTIYWDPASDDCGVEAYYVFVNGAFKTSTTINQVTLSGLVSGETYDIRIQAVDFVGRVSPLSSILSFTAD